MFYLIHVKSSGSSREHAVIGLKEAGVEVVIASSAGRIWYRNAINLALPVIFSPGLSNMINEDKEIEVDLKTGEIYSLTQDKVLQGELLTDFIMNIFENGGIKQMLTNRGDK